MGASYVQFQVNYVDVHVVLAIDCHQELHDVHRSIIIQNLITMVSPIKTGKSSTGTIFVDLYKTSLIDPREKGEPGPLSYILLLTGSPQDNQPADIVQ